MILYYSQCYGINTQQILQDVDSKNASTVVLLGETEWEIRDVTREFVQELKNRNVTLKIVHGSCRNEYYDNLYNELGIPIENVIFWGTHWINWSYQNLLGSGYRPESYIVDTNNFKHKFISLNNRSHIQRCVFIDEMAKQNLINKGVVTWVKHLNENSDYPYQYFDNRQLLLDDDFVTKLDSFLLPKEWHESLLHVVTECTPDVYCISEKTFIPLLMKKPFIVFGAKGFSKKLTDLGFQLYDNVFDYSFDNIDDLHERAELFVNNLHILDKYDCKELYGILYPRIKHNYDRAIEILLDNSFIPDTMIDFYNSHPNDSVAGKIYTFLNQRLKKIRWYSIWRRNENYLNEVDSSNTSEVIVDNTVETMCCQLEGDQLGVKKLADVCETHQVPLTLLSAGYRFNEHLIDEHTKNKITIVDNNCFWIAKHMQAMLAKDNYDLNLERGYDILDNNVGLASSIEYLYITMNNLAKFHRCMMMDYLSKHNLIDRGAIAWRDTHRYYDGQRPLPPGKSESDASGYVFQYWKPQKLYLDFVDDNTSHVNQNILPSQYKNSFMQLVAESENEIFFLSEKTSVPLLCNKPFLVVSTKDYHKNLQELGFLLYDELFDYSFDSLENSYQRIQQIILQVKKFESYTNQQLLDLTKQIEHKLKYNRRLAITYIHEVMNQYRPYLCKLENQEIYTQLGFINMLDNYADRL